MPRGPRLKSAGKTTEVDDRHVPLARALSCVVADESEHYLAGLTEALDLHRHALSPVRPAAMDALIDVTRQHHPDVVLLGCDPAARALAVAQQLDAPLVVLTGWWREDDVIALLQAGVSGLLARAASTTDIVSALCRVHNGDLVYPAGWERLLVGWLRSGGRHMGTGVNLLTPRERQIVGLIVSGCSTKHLADRLGIAQQTAKNHLSHIMRKVGVASRLQLCTWGIEQGLNAQS